MSVLFFISPDLVDEKDMVAGWWPELFSHSGASTAGRGPLRQLPHFASRASAAARESASILRHPDRLSAALPIPLHHHHMKVNRWIFC
jgi:hypothetical protein